jgi:hypothetical protein
MNFFIGISCLLAVVMDTNGKFYSLPDEPTSINPLSPAWGWFSGAAEVLRPTDRTDLRGSERRKIRKLTNAHGGLAAAGWVSEQLGERDYRNAAKSVA